MTIQHIGIVAWAIGVPLTILTVADLLEWLKRRLGRIVTGPQDIDD